MKRKIVRIPAGYMAEAILSGTIGGLRARIEAVGVPSSARYIGVWHYHKADAFDFVFEDDSFPETAPGCEFMHAEVIYHEENAKREHEYIDGMNTLAGLNP